MEQNILCQRDDQVALTDLFEGVSRLLKDCDDSKEKERLKEIIHSMNDTVSYVFLGEEAVGKTSLMKKVFQNVVDVDWQMSADVCEYRYGEQAFASQPISGYQKRFVPSENLKGISLVDTRAINKMTQDGRQKLSELIEKCQVLFVVLDVRRVGSPGLWDVMEEFHAKNMTVFVTKCDLVSEEEMAAAVEKTKSYLREAGITAAVFPVSLTRENVVAGIVPIDEACLYIRNEIVGENPILAKQERNVEEIKGLLKELDHSFSLRRRQYDSDAAILKKINAGLDRYVVNQEKRVAGLIDQVTEDINREITSYQNEIISRLDPYKIKERFRSQQDFTDYLNTVNDNYKKIMNDSVNQKTISVIKECLHELEMVFEDAVGFFNERENILALNDRFYGSLSTSRKNMVTDTKQNTYEISNCYKTLYDASETLFLEIWKERKRYDRARLTERTLSVGGGALGGALGGAAIASAVFKAGTAAMTFGMTGLVIIGVIVGAVVVAKIASNLYDPRNADRMEEAVQKSIAQFKEEVNRTRTQMIEQVSAQMKEIFSNELAIADGYFKEFRMSVNIEERNLPLLETNLEQIHDLLRAIEQK